MPYKQVALLPLGFRPVLGPYPAYLECPLGSAVGNGSHAAPFHEYALGGVFMTGPVATGGTVHLVL